MRFQFFLQPNGYVYEFYYTWKYLQSDFFKLSLSARILFLFILGKTDDPCIPLEFLEKETAKLSNNTCIHFSLYLLLVNPHSISCIECSIMGWSWGLTNLTYGSRISIMDIPQPTVATKCNHQWTAESSCFQKIPPEDQKSRSFSLGRRRSGPGFDQPLAGHDDYHGRRGGAILRYFRIHKLISCFLLYLGFLSFRIKVGIVFSSCGVFYHLMPGGALELPDDHCWVLGSNHRSVLPGGGEGSWLIRWGVFISLIAGCFGRVVRKWENNAPPWKDTVKRISKRY